MFRLRRRRPLIVLSVGWALLLPACGGSDDPPADSSSVVTVEVESDDTGPAVVDTIPDSAGETDQPEASADGFTVPEGFATVDGLISEVAGVPLPEPALYQPGTAYTSDQDPRETAFQTVFSTLEPLDLAAFFFAEIPKSELTIASFSGAASTIEEVPTDGREIVIAFDRPDGLQGLLLISAGGAISASQVQINVLYNGAR